MTDENQPLDGDLSDTIAMLEQILEVMPEDGVALKALYNAYRSAGLSGKAFEYLTRLVNAVVSSGDKEELSFVRSELGAFEEDFPLEVEAQLAQLGGPVSGELDSGVVTSSASVAEDALVDEGADGEVDISEELALAWRLHEDDQLSQDEYSSVVHDLTEVSTKELAVPISVLHVLADRGFVQMNRIMNHMSSVSGSPFLSIADFELNERLVGVFPPRVYSKEGAIPFGFVGEDLMVGVLNPLNHALSDKIERVSKRRCHTYLVAPEDYDAALEKLRKLTSGD
ncbi:MAG TPA: hypothetical protein VIR63_06885 [Pontiella sp.]